MGLQFWVIAQLGHAEDLRPNKIKGLLHEEGIMKITLYAQERKHVWEH
jgi:hypothetical protein